MKCYCAAVLVSLVGSIAHSQSVDSFTGHTLRIGQHITDDYVPYGFQDERVVDPGGTLFGPFNQRGGNELYITVYESRIEFDFLYDAYWEPAFFNGFLIEDALGTLSSFQDVTIASTVDYAFTDERMWFTDDILYLDFRGLDFFASSALVLDVSFVPAPGIGVASLVVSCGLIGIRRRRP